MAKVNIITADYLRSILDYDHETGIFRWKHRESVERQINTRLSGNIAGGKDAYGYVSIRIDDKMFKAHRLAWAYVNGVMPEGQIDHINGIVDDNRIINLRQCDHSENQQNITTRANSKSGFSGACWHKGAHKWRAYIVINYKQVHLGLFDTPEDAHEAYLVAKKEHHAFQPTPRT